MQNDCFLEVKDKKYDVRGESDDTEFGTWIGIEEWHWGASNRAQTAGFATTNVRGDVREFVFLAKVDTSTPPLLTACRLNAVLDRAELIMRRAGGTAQRYISIKFTKLQVKDVDLVHDAQNLIPRQRVTMSFESLEFTYTPQSQIGANRSGGLSFDWHAPAN